MSYATPGKTGNPLPRHFMNKILIAFIIFFSISGHSFSQMKFGLKAGINVSKVKNKSANNFTNNLNFNTGLVANFQLDKKFLLDAECILSAKGFNSTLIPTGEVATRLYYLTLPILLEYKATKKFYLQMGPELNFLVGSKMKNKSTDLPVTSEYNKVDLTLAAGLGYRIFKNVKLEARYSYGLSQIKKRPEIFGDQYNRTLQFNLIYFFR